MAAIIIRDLSFSYPLVNRRKRANNGAFRNEIRVFTNLSLEVRDGMRLAIIGRNGAGKSTLLRLVAGILPPTEGSLRIEGVVSPLLNLRLGMEPEMTGIENIRLRGAYMGRTLAEIDERLPQIVEFADLGEFIDLPLSTYSTGMVARLAFSIATSFNPEILVMDESVGTVDKQFRVKAAARLRQFINHSNILLLATHNERLIKGICNRTFNTETFEINSL